MCGKALELKGEEFIRGDVRGVREVIKFYDLENLKNLTHDL